MYINYLPFVALVMLLPVSSAKAQDQGGKRKPVPPWNTIGAVAVSPDCKKIVTMNAANNTEMWDFYRVQKTNRYPEPLLSFSGLGGTSGARDWILFGQDGTKFYVGRSAGPIEVDANSGVTLRLFHDRGDIAGVIHMKLGPDGKTIVTHNSRQIKVWDIAAGECTKTIRVLPASGNDEIDTFAVAANSPRVLIGTRLGEISGWDLETSEKVYSRPRPAKQKTVYGLAFIEGDKKAIFSQAKEGIVVWDLEKDRLERVISDNATGWLVVSPNGRFLGGGTGALWDLKTGNHIIVTAHKDYELSSHAFAFSSDSRYLVLAGGRSSKAWANRLPHFGVVENRALVVWDLRTRQVAGLLAYPSPQQR